MSLNIQISAHFDSFFAYSSIIMLKGEAGVIPGMPPTIIPELQNRSIISVVNGRSGPGPLTSFYGSTSSHFGALTSSGKLLTWGEYSGGALGLGDPSELPVGSPGGYREEKQRGQPRVYGPPPEVTTPTEVRFDHGLRTKGRVERYCLAVAAGEWDMGALVVDLTEDEVLLEDLEQHNI